MTIDSVKLSDKRNKFYDKQADKVVVIEYTYENIASDRDVDIFGSNFKVYDASGNILSTYPVSDKVARAVGQGKKCTANLAFALNNDSNEIEIDYYGNLFNSKPTKKFKIVAE
jgi:predicted nucleotidyltransferase